MNPLKKFTVALICILLFVSLSLFGLVVMANRTVLNPDFVVSQLDRLDLYSLAKGLLKDQLPQPIEFTGEFIGDIVGNLQPEIKKQARDLVYAGYAYFTGADENLDLTISLVQVKEELRKTLAENQARIIPSYLANAPQGIINQYIDGAYKDMIKNVPDKLEYHQNSWGQEVQNTLGQISLIVGYFILSFRVLIGLILLLIMGLLILYRPVKSAVRLLGVIFLCAGILQLVIYLIVNNLALSQLARLQTPYALQQWLPPFINDFLVSLAVVSAVVMVTGVILIIAGSLRFAPQGNAPELAPVTRPVFTCFQCGASNSPGDKFCIICGSQFQHYCPSCSAPVDLTEQFCTQCGNKLVEP